MKKNIGTADRIVRMIISLLAFGVMFFVSSVYLKVGLTALGIFALYESLVGWCAFYALIGRNTCPIE